MPGLFFEIGSQLPSSWDYSLEPPCRHYDCITYLNKKEALEVLDVLSLLFCLCV
jgi:hypothetical protein